MVRISHEAVVLERGDQHVPTRWHAGDGECAGDIGRSGLRCAQPRRWHAATGHRIERRLDERDDGRHARTAAIDDAHRTRQRARGVGGERQIRGHRGVCHVDVDRGVDVPQRVRREGVAPRRHVEDLVVAIARRDHGAAHAGGLGHHEDAYVVVRYGRVTADRRGASARSREQPDVGQRRRDHVAVTIDDRDAGIDGQSLPHRAGERIVARGVRAQRDGRGCRHAIRGALRGQRELVRAIRAADRDAAHRRPIDVDGDDTGAGHACRCFQVEHAAADLNRCEARRCAACDLLADRAVVTSRLRDRITRRVVATSAARQQRAQAKRHIRMLHARLVGTSSRQVATNTQVHDATRARCMRR